MVKREIPSDILERLKNSPFVNWVENDDNRFAIPDKKIMIFRFDKLLDQPEVEMYNKFIIKKGSYENKLEEICMYINFFIDTYDLDNELAMAYLKLKFSIDKERLFTVENMDDFIDFLYKILFTDSICQKIDDMITECYIDDIEINDKNKKFKDNKHLESLEFTNQHMRILLKISYGMKIMSPIMLHYFSLNNIKLEKDSDVLFRFYQRLLYIFSENVNIYNKLLVYVKAKVIESKSHNNLMFEQQEIFGEDQYTVVEKFVKTILISEIIVKYDLPKVWIAKENKFKENITGFNKTIIKYQLYYFRKRKFEAKPTEVTHIKNPDGLSGQDKLEMNMNKIDESMVIFSDLNFRWGLAKLRQLVDIDISEEEVEYYMINWCPDSVQQELIYAYYARHFGGQRDLLEATRRQMVILALLMKKRMLLEACKEDEKIGSEISAILPYILTGNKVEASSRMVRNNRLLTKIKDSDLYKTLVNVKYKSFIESTTKEGDEDFIIKRITSLSNSVYTYNTFEEPELTGTDIKYNEDTLGDEILYFLSNN